MANVSVSSLILFIASMTLAVGVAGTLVTNVSQISHSIDERSVGISEKLETEIEVISDPGSDALYDSGTDELTLLVKNTGERTLSSEPDAIDVLVNGKFVDPSSMTTEVVDDTEWNQGSVVRITVDRTLGTGSQRVVVIVNEDREVFTFHR